MTKLPVTADEIINVFGPHKHYPNKGTVRSNPQNLFVFTSAPHRKEAINACDEMVDRIKKEIPLWGKEILEDESHIWKENR